MDTFKLIGSALTSIALGWSSMTAPVTQDSMTLVGQWPVEAWPAAEVIPTPEPETPSVVEPVVEPVDEPAELNATATAPAFVPKSVPQPVPDPVPDQSTIDAMDELKDIAVRLQDYALDLDEQAQEIRDAAKQSIEGFGSYRPKPDTNTTPTSCQCDCDCPDEARLRVILQEELQAALVKYNVAKTPPLSNVMPTTSNSSTGGTVVSSSTTSGGYYSAPVVTRPVVPVRQPAFIDTPRFAVYSRVYAASSGCTVRETTWSDGTRTNETISCPARRR